MKRSGYSITLAFAIIVCLSLYGAESWAAERVYQASGEISAIDLEYDTVVVEVPVAGRVATVGGPVSPGAVLKQAGKSVDLGSFKVGDRVIVKWQVIVPNPANRTVFARLLICQVQGGCKRVQKNHASFAFCSAST